MDDPVDEWLETCSENTKVCYRTYFKSFETFMNKKGAEMLDEARKNAIVPEKMDYYAQRIFEFYRTLLSGQVKAKVTGSVKGRVGGWTGRFKDKPLSQHTARTAVSAVRSFFAFHNLPINLKKFTRKDARMRKPQVERKKHQLVASEIQTMLRIANARDKAILSLGLMGQDESTVASLRMEQFEGKINGTKLEFIDMLRKKTNEPTKILLTLEVQRILTDYVKSLQRKAGWLFKGYRDMHITEQLCNEIFKQLCEQSEIKDNGRRLSFHCCRMWFSTQLRNKISDDIIDMLTGHEIRFGGAYLADDEQKLRELLSNANVEDLLRLQEASPQNGLVKEVEAQNAKIAEQERTIGDLRKIVVATRGAWLEMKRKYEPFMPTASVKVRPNKELYNPKSETQTLKDEMAELRKEIEALKHREKTLQTEPRKPSAALDAALKE